MFSERFIISAPGDKAIILNFCNLLTPGTDYIYCEIALRSMLQNTFDDKSILVQVMAWVVRPSDFYHGFTL